MLRPIWGLCLLLSLLAITAEAFLVPKPGPWRALSEEQQTQVEQFAAQVAATPELSAQLKPGYHVTPPGGWMNDPNGPLEHAGVFHLFYQFNPAAPTWDRPHWGHVASTDLVHWQQLPAALSPDTDYDKDGVFSGSATVLNNGTPVIMYTGVSRQSDVDYYYQVQAVATATQGEDPLLVGWTKRAEPVVSSAPPGGNHAQFRDPTTGVWVERRGGGGGGSYFLAVGAQLECQGGAALYESGRDFASWDFRGPLFSITALSNGSSHASCPTPLEDADPEAQQQGEEGEDLATCPADAQFAASCPMWECPDWWPIDGDVSMFKYSDQVEGRRPFGRDWYVLSDRPVDFGARAGQEPPDIATAPNHGALLVASVGGERYHPKLLDHGEVYASKAFRAADGRIIWWGWAFESSAGCEGMCGSGTPFTQALGWQGAQTLPREIAYDAAAASLLLNPVAEVEGLRQRQIFDGRFDLLGPHQERTLVEGGAPPAGAASGQPLRRLELLLRFNLTGGGHPSEGQQRFRFSVGATLELGGGARLLAGVNGSAADDSAAGAVVTDAEVWADTRGVGGATQGMLWGGPAELPRGGLPARDLELRLFLDGSLLEVFGLGGRGRVTVRAYPLDAAASWGAALISHAPEGVVAVHARAWEMGGCWVDELELPAAAP